MKSASLTMLASLAGVFFLVSESVSLAAHGGGGRHGGGGGGRAASRGGGGGGGHAVSRGGGGGRVGGMGGGGRSAHASRPSVSGGGYGGGGSRVASRPSSSHAGGMVPRKNISGGNINRSQAAAKIKSPSKGTGTGLPSVAQGKKPGTGTGGNKSFPDLAGKTGGGQLADKVQGAKGGQLAGKVQGAQGGQLAGKVQGAKGGQLAEKVQGAQGGQLAGKVQGAKGSQLAGKVQGAQGGQLAGKGQGAKGSQLAGKVQGAQGGQLADKIQGVKGGQLAGRVQGAQGGQFAGKLQGDNQGRFGNNLSPERNQALANRQQYWDKWGKDNQGKLSNFKADRSKDWSGINDFRKDQNVVGSFNKPEWNNYKNNVNNFRNNRSIEINNNIQNHFDNNFNAGWWGSSGWYRGPSFYGGNPWWWWGAATVATAGTFLALDAIHDATYQPPVYDYGVNVVYQGDEVYVDGQPTATAQEYSQQAIALANTSDQQPPAPSPPEPGQPAEWLPMGVWALGQEDKGDAYMFFQISIDKNGVVTGAYQNVLSGEKSPISGQVDKKTQRVAWKIGTNNTVIETGLQNLTQDVASCLLHFGPDTTQTWLLVRLKQPEMPDAPQNTSEETKES
jgi:hypothetical protein